MPGPVHRQQVENDLKASMAQAMLENPDLTPDAALAKIAQSLLEHNPFVPPTEGCPINALPTEILAHIFYIGVKMETEGQQMNDGDDDDYSGMYDDDDSDDSDEDDAMKVDITAEHEHGPGCDHEHEHEHDDNDIHMGSDGSWDDDEPSFQMLVSHVCSHWRAVALNEPSLWTTLRFDLGYSLETAKSHIERSKGLPLDIFIDASLLDGGSDIYEVDDEALPADGTAATVLVPAQPPAPAATVVASEAMDAEEAKAEADDEKECLSEADVAAILDLIVPEAHRWKLIEVQTSHYATMFLVLTRLRDIPSAPNLEALQLLQRDDEIEDLETGLFSTPELAEPMLLFHGNVPKLNALGLWGVHIDWDASLSFLSGLKDVELAYHYNNVRPPYAVFSQMVLASPDLEILSLCGSGPTGSKEVWGGEPAISIPSLVDLVLGQHEVDYIVNLFPKLHVPNVRSLVLDFDSADYNALVDTLVLPHNDEKHSLLRGLEHLKISGLPCSEGGVQKFLKELDGLKSFNINCMADEEMHYFEALVASVKEGGAAILCPVLETLTTRSVDSQEVRAFLDARKKAGKPILRLEMSRQDDISNKDQKWFDANLEEFTLFDPSDSEEEMFEVDGDEVYDENT